MHSTVVKQRVLQIVLAILALGAAVYGASYWQTNYLAGVSMVQMPVPAADIPPYTLLDASMFVSHEFPRALLGQGYAASANELAGKISAGTLFAGQPVSVRLAVPPEQFRLADPALEVLSIPAECTNGVGCQVRVGEQVNIYRLQKPPEQEDVQAVGIMDDGTPPETTPAPETQVVFVATVPVVAVLSGDGQVAMQSSDNANQDKQPMKILVVAAPADVVQAILNAVARTKFEETMLWVTLATP